MERIPGIVWLKVPSGVFRMGSVSESDALAPPDETPQHDSILSTFYISETPITNAQYRLFVDATGYTVPGHWLDGCIPDGLDDHPVTYVDWRDACAFCDWADCRLPGEEEWEKAARGCDGRRYPWGDEPPSGELTNFAGNVGTTTPVGCYPLGVSPYGLQDTAGNVMEWTDTVFRPYPLPSFPDTTEGPIALRGGSYLHPATCVRCARRHSFFPTARDEYIGFRVASGWKRKLTDHGTTEEPDKERSDKAKTVHPYRRIVAPEPSRRTDKARSILVSRPSVTFDWVNIPGGPFRMGSGTSEIEDALFHEETPQLRVFAQDFLISRTPVTNGQYQRFVEGTGYPSPGHWLDRRISESLADHPVTYVDWYDACAFCAWSGCRLPTEAEWEKAARGVDGRRYPWGEDSPDVRQARFAVMAGETTAEVRHAPLGASPYGVLDMAGNVWEWVHTLYRPYPYNSADGREEDASPDRRVLRGGSFLSPDARYLRCAARSRSYPVRRRDHIGFRVVWDELAKKQTGD